MRRTNLPLLGLIENMSGYVCPHCSDIVGVFGQGGGEDFCRREEERKLSTVEGEGGGCRFLGRIPIDRDLVGLLDDVGGVAATVSQTDAEKLLAGEEAAVAPPKRKTLVERYMQIPSFPIVRELVKKVVVLIDMQKVAEDEARTAAGL